MNIRSVAFVLILSCVYLQSTGQSPKDSVSISIRPYGSFRGHFAVYNEELELQENASRIGFELSVQKRSARYFVVSELSLNMFRGDVQFNPDASTSGGFVDIENDQVNQVFGTRLGYLGVALNRGGTFVIGKQWSVYYDVAQYTDKFNVFGCKGSAIYIANTDGGTTGTGRADQAITYRNQFGPLTVGLQVQARSAFDGSFFDGYGISAQMRIRQGLQAGAAYYRPLLQDTLQQNTIGFTNNPEYMVFGISYVTRRLTVGVIYADQSNGDLRRNIVGNDLAAIVYDGQGIEACIKYTINRFTLVGGYNRYNPETTHLPLDERFNTEFFIAGLEYRPGKYAYFYSETRINTDKNRNHQGIKDLNVFTLGLRLDVERTISRTIK